MHTIVLRSIVFGQHASVGVRIVATDNDNGLDVELTDNLEAFFELLLFLELRTPGANHVEAASVTVFVNNLLGQLHVVMLHQTARPHQETVNAVSGVELLHGVEEARNHVMTARSLASRQDDTNIHRFMLHILTGNKLHKGHSVGVGKETLNVLLIVYTLCRSTLLHLYCTLQSARQLRLIRGSCNLQCTFFHNY